MASYDSKYILLENSKTNIIDKIISWYDQKINPFTSEVEWGRGA